MNLIKKIKQSVKSYMYEIQAKKWEREEDEKDQIILKILESLNSKEKPASTDEMYKGHCGWIRENDKDTPRAHKWKLDNGGSWSKKHYPAKEGEIVMNCENCNDTRQILVPASFRKEYRKLYPLELIPNGQ